MVVQQKKKRNRQKCRIKKGDLVVAITGEDAAKSKPGKVLRIYPRTQRVLVEGYNQVKKHMRKTQDNPHGGIVDMEAPIHISNLKRYESGEEKPTPRTRTKARKGPDKDASNG